MLERFGHIIPLVLVTVLGVLALSILVMYRSLLDPCYIHEGFEDTSTPPPAANAAQRTMAINNIKSSASGTNPNAKDDKITEINTFILTSITNMVNMFKTLPDGINNALGQVIDVTDDTCYIVKLIEAKYTKKPVDAAAANTKNGTLVPPSHLTKSREQKLSIQKNQFLTNNKGAKLLECFVDGQDSSGEQQDISGAKQDISGAKQDISGAHQDISGYTFGAKKTADTVPSTDISGAMMKKHAEEEKKIMAAQTQLLQYQAQISSIMNTNDYKTLVASLKQALPTAQFGSQFIAKNKADIIEGYQNPAYKYPVPYNNSDLDNKQKEHLQVLDTAYNLLITVFTDLGKNYMDARAAHDQLLKDYRTIDPSYRP